MRPPNSTDCLMMYGPASSPGLFSVVIQVASASDLRPESTATPKSGWRSAAPFLADAAFLSLSAAGCEDDVCSLGDWAKSVKPHSPTPINRRREDQILKTYSFLFISSPPYLRFEEHPV